MNKESLAKAVAGQTGGTKAEALKFIDAILNAIQGSLKKGETVTLIGFGSFKVSKRKSRTGRNPRTGKSISIPQKTVLSFKAGKGLKETVKQKK